MSCIVLCARHYFSLLKAFVSIARSLLFVK